MEIENTGQETTPSELQVGELVILRDSQRAVIVEILPRKGEPSYVVQLVDGDRIEVEADGLIRAKTYANWVAPDSDWDGSERRRGQGTFDGSERRRP